MVGILVMPVGVVLAQAPAGPLVTDRPDQTESAVTVRPGFVQIESGLSYTHTEEGGTRVRTVTLPGTLIRIGILERVEARVGFAGWQRAQTRVQGSRFTDAGIGDLEIGAKLRLVAEGKGWPQLAILVSTTLPTGQMGLSSERADPTILLAGSNTISDRMSLGYNVGAQWTTADVGGILGGVPVLETVVHTPYSLAIGLTLANRVGAFVEAFGALDLDENGTNPVSVAGGVTFLLRKNLQLDLSGGFGINEAADDWFVAGGVALRVPQ
jgi:hypothetical protein